MANINSYLVTISRGVYGRDVRDAIHDAIQAVNNDLPNSSSVVAEVQEARRNASGVLYNRLKGRLDADYNLLLEKITQQTEDGHTAQIAINNATIGYSSLKNRLDSQFEELSNRLLRVKGDADRAEAAATSAESDLSEVQTLAASTETNASNAARDSNLANQAMTAAQNYATGAYNDRVAAQAAKDAAVMANSNAEAYAVGTRDGVDVASTDVAYHNNAKYFAEQMTVDNTLTLPGHPADAKKVGDDLADLRGDLSDKVNIAQGVAYAGKTLVIDSSGNVVPGDSSVTIEVDDTLTIKGEAADARKVGNEITPMNEKPSYFDGRRTRIKPKWTQGWVNGSGEELDNEPTRIRTGFIDIRDIADIGFRFGTNDKYRIFVALYDVNKNHISNSSGFNITNKEKSFSFHLSSSRASYCRIIAWLYNSSASIAPSEGDSIEIYVYQFVPCMSDSAGRKIEMNTKYGDGHYFILDEQVESSRSVYGTPTANAGETNGYTTRRSVYLPKFANDVNYVIAFSLDGQVPVKSLYGYEISGSNSAKTEYKSLVTNIGENIISIIDARNSNANKIYAVIVNDDIEFNENFFTAHPVVFMDYISYLRGESETKLIEKYYTYSETDSMPKDYRLWHKAFDGVYSQKIVPYRTGVNYAIQSVLIPYTNVTSITITSSGSSSNLLRLILFDKNKNLVGWSAGGVIPGPSTPGTELAFKSGYSYSNIAYISYVIENTSQSATINPDSFNYSSLTMKAAVSTSQASGVTTDSPVSLSIMSYNIGHYAFGLNPIGLNPTTADRYIAGMKAFFGKYNPDILFLQEFSNTLIAGQSDSANAIIYDPLFKYYSNNDGEWNTIRTNYKIKNARYAYVLPLNPYSNSKPYRYCEITVNGHTVALCSAHTLAGLPSSGSAYATAAEARAYEVEKLLELFDNAEYGILAGDFNSAEEGEKESMNAAAIAKGFTPVNGGYFGWQYTFRNDNPHLWYDNIFVKGDIKIRYFKSLIDEVTDLPSDHIPIYAEIDII